MPAEREKLDWVKQADGSILASSEDKIARQITRCYPIGAKFDCLTITATKPGMILLGREIRVEPETPNGQDIDEFEASRVGYSCNIYLETGMETLGEGVNFYKEMISSEKGILRKQDISLRPLFSEPNRSQWSAKDVDQFISANGLIANELWFNCGRIAEIIDNGSVASLETNLVSHDEVFGGT